MITIENVAFTCGGYTAAMQCWQWGYHDRIEYLERGFDVSAYGRVYREKINKTRRVLVVTFLREDAVIDRLRQLAITAFRTALPVTLTYDEDGSPVTMVLDWPTLAKRDVLIENRAAIEITATGHIT